MASKRAFAPGTNDDKAGSSRRIAGGGLYIGDAGRVGVALAQLAPLVPKPEEGDGPDLHAALALSIAEEANWTQFTAVIRSYVMEEEAR
jgi:hypothetical protein